MVLCLCDLRWAVEAVVGDEPLFQCILLTVAMCLLSMANSMAVPWWLHL